MTQLHAQSDPSNYTREFLMTIKQINFMFLDKYTECSWDETLSPDLLLRSMVLITSNPNPVYRMHLMH